MNTIWKFFSIRRKFRWALTGVGVAVFLISQLFNIDIGFEPAATDLEPNQAGSAGNVSVIQTVDLAVLHDESMSTQATITPLPTLMDGELSDTDSKESKLEAAKETESHVTATDPALEVVKEPTVTPLPDLDTDESDESNEATAVVEIEPTVEPIPVVEIEPTTPPLPAKWYIDSDFNGVPNFMEIELGYDPLNEDCFIDYCSAVIPPPVQENSLGGVGNFEGNIMIILDVSGSMGDPMGNQSRMEAAKEALTKYVNDIPEGVNVGLIVYGHQGDATEAGKEASCAGVEAIGQLGSVTSGNIGTLLSPYQPNGWTPIGDALNLAYSQMQLTGENNKVVLVTDGLETCDSNPVTIANTISSDPNVQLVVDVVGFGISLDAEREELKQIAEAGGGLYINVEEAGDFDDYVKAQRDRDTAILDWVTCSARAHSNYFQCRADLSNEARPLLGDLKRALEDPAAIADLNQMLGRLQDWDNMHSEFGSAYFDSYNALQTDLKNDVVWGSIDIRPENEADEQVIPYYPPIEEDELGTALPTIDQRPADCAPGSGQNFAGQDLSSADFSGQNLRNANFQGATLNFVNFEGADLTCANLRGAKIAQTNFISIVANWAIFAEITMTQNDFTNGQLEYADFSQSDVSGVDFSGVTLVGAQAIDARFRNNIWSYAICSDRFLAGRDGGCYFP